MKNLKRKKNLNGIPGNLANFYLSSMNYNRGYMPDWLYYAAKNANELFLVIDVLENKISPASCDIKKLHTGFGRLREIIETQLKNFGFENSCIVKVVFKFEINLESKIIYCNPHIVDTDGNVYTCKRTISERAYPINTVSIKNSIKDNRLFIVRLFDFFFIKRKQSF